MLILAAAPQISDARVYLASSKMRGIDMKRFHVLLAVSILSILAFGAASSGEKPRDGKTAAVESICDPLKEEGITPGLYGMCVAFCEAQDFASLDDPLSASELEQIVASAPSGKLLENYNRRRNPETDPPMPCIVEEPCPCWTSEQLASIDGLSPTNTTYDQFFCQGDEYALIVEANGGGEEQFAYGEWNTQCLGDDCNEVGACVYYCSNCGGGVISTSLSTEEGTLSSEQARACQDQVILACQNAGLPFP